MKERTSVAGLLLALFVLCFGLSANADDNMNSSPIDQGNLVLAQADTADAKTDTVAGEGVAVESNDTEAKEEAKWWNVSISYTLSHNLARERPVVSNSLSLDPSFMLPKDISLSIHLGGYVSTLYPSDVVGGNDVRINEADFDPLSISISRAFQIDPEITGFTITPSLVQVLPETSRFAGWTRKWYYAIKPGVSFSISKWGLSLSNSNSFQKNVHGYTDYRFKSDVDGGIESIPLNEWTYSNATSLRLSVWKLNMGVAVVWSYNWRYHTSDGNEARHNNIAYSADIGINAYENLNVSLGISTAGPERRYGGFQNDYTYPLDPQFSAASLTLSYSF